MVKIRVKIGTLMINGKSYSKGEEVDVDKEILKKLDKRDYEIVEEKNTGKGK